MDQITTFLQDEAVQNALWGLAGFVAGYIFPKLKAWAAGTENKVDDVIVEKAEEVVTEAIKKKTTKKAAAAVVATKVE